MNTADANSPVAAAAYAGWHGSDFTTADVSWDMYTHMKYAFAVTTPEVTQLSLNGYAPELLPRFVEAAQKNVRFVYTLYFPVLMLTAGCQHSELNICLWRAVLSLC